MSGCAAGSTVCDADGYWYCEYLVEYYAGQYANGIAECSTAPITGAFGPTTEEGNTQMLGGWCCSDCTSVCDVALGAAARSAARSGLVAALLFAAAAAALL